MLNKFATEVRLFDFEFAEQPEISAGALISAATVTQQTLFGSGSLTLGSASISGSTVQIAVGGGVKGSVYRIICTIDTDNALRLVAEGDIEIQ